MEIGVKEVAELLDVSEKTIYRWIAAEQIPFFKVGSQYRFSKSRLNEWLLSRSSATSTLWENENSGNETYSLERALKNSGIFYRVSGKSTREAIGEIVSLVSLPNSIDKERLTAVLCEREKLSSTAVGDGIAIPHSRDALLSVLDKSVVSLNFLNESIEFSAIDGIPVKILFLILCPSLKAHLSIMSRLNFVLRNKEFLKMLNEEAQRDKILSFLAENDKFIERKTNVEHGKGANHVDL